MKKRILILALFASVALPAFATTATTIAAATAGANATIKGVVESIIDDDEFMITDATGSIEVYLGPNPVPVTVGETVTVNGFIDDGEFARDICATTIMRSNGEVIEIANCDG